MKNLPDKIYLVIDTDDEPVEDFKDLTDVTWCVDRITKQDIPYYRKGTRKWTDIDLSEFAEWLDAWGWKQAFRGIWYQRTSPKIQKTTSQLREQWEIETGRRKP